MKVDFKVAFKNWKGEPLTVTEEVPGKKDPVSKPLMMNEQLMEILYYYGMTSQVSNDKKYKAHKIYKKLERGETEFTTEDLALIKEIAGEKLVAGTMGQLYDLIEDCKNSKTDK